MNTLEHAMPEMPYMPEDFVTTYGEEQEKIAAKKKAAKKKAAKSYAIVERIAEKLQDQKEQLEDQQDELDKIAQIIWDVDGRCMSADGPVPSTMQEMTQDEMSEIYTLASGKPNT